MKKVYSIEFTKDYLNFKKGDRTNQYSRDISNILVNTIKVAKFAEFAELKQNISKKGK